MRAALITEDRRLSAADVPEPVLRPGHVLLKIHYCGICGSDLGALKDASRFGTGYTLGHEIVGEVIEAAADVPEWSPGDRVAVYHAAGCGECAMCLTDRSYRCLNALSTSLGHGVVPGGYAERIVVPKSLLYAIPDDMTYRRGSLAEPLAIAIHGINQAGLRADDAVCILGAGPIGALTACALKIAGHEKVVVVEPNPDRQATVEALGVRTVGLDGADAAVREVLGQAPSVVVECSGNKFAAGQGIEIVAPFGRVVLQGRPADLSPVDQNIIGRKELHVIGAASCTQAEFQQAIDDLANSNGAYDSLVSAVYSLEEAQEAYDQLRRPGNAHVKIVLTGVPVN